MEVKTEGLVTHYMPDNTHAAHINCWCNPDVQNVGQTAKGTTVQHHRVAGRFYVASQTD